MMKKSVMILTKIRLVLCLFVSFASLCTSFSFFMICFDYLSFFKAYKIIKDFQSGSPSSNVSYFNFFTTFYQ